jgi:membrane-associated protein
METFVDLFLHLDQHLRDATLAYGPWIYGLLFLIIFAETGLVVTPILPGDSLLFAAGALAATVDPETGAHLLRVELVAVLLLVAAILGDAVNYAVGHYIGPRIFTASDNTGLLHRVLNRNHLAQAHAFFEKYGGKAVVLGRWVPIVRTFVPFVAGAGAMTYRTFFVYNVVGAVIWVGVCIGAGYLFGNIPVVQKNFSLVMLGIIAVSLIPAAIEFLRHRQAQAKAKAKA